MQVLMQLQPPFWAIGHIVDNAAEGDKFPGAAFAGIAAEFELCDKAIGEGHPANYTRYWLKRKSGAHFQDAPAFFGNYSLITPVTF